MLLIVTFSITVKLDIMFLRAKNSMIQSLYQSKSEPVVRLTPARDVESTNMMAFINDLE